MSLSACCTTHNQPSLEHLRRVSLRATSQLHLEPLRLSEFLKANAMSSIFGWSRRLDSSRRRELPRARRLRLEPLERRRLLTGFLFTVDTELDVVNAGDGLMSLREAVTRSNQLVDSDDTIDFDSSLAGKPLVLLGGEFTISDAVTIRGLGAALTTIDGQNGSRLFAITTTEGNVTFDGLTLTRGKTTLKNQGGGAIRSDYSGSLTVNNCVVASNSTTGDSSGGGGIRCPGPLTIANTTIAGNSTVFTSSSGGGIACNLLTITNSTVSGNYVVGQGSLGVARGGGIIAGAATITSSTISGNFTGGPGGHGGGVFVVGALTVTNCTITGNSVKQTSAEGGGVYVTNGPTTIRNSIIAGNLDLIDGSHPALRPGRALAVQYSLIDNNSGSTLTVSPTDSADSSGNLIGTPAAPIDALLGPLAGNGGPTQTHQPTSGSPVIDAGSNGVAVDPALQAAIAFDQRGRARILDTNSDGVETVDMGAVEGAPPVLSLSGAMTYVENAAPAVIASGAGLSDADSANFKDGKLTVRITANSTPNDRVAIRHSGAGAGQIGLAGSSVTFAGTTIGSFYGGVDKAPLVVSFNASATLAATQALVRAITFQTLGDNPSTTNRTLAFVLADGAGGTSAAATATKTVRITAGNDPPEVTVSETVTYREAAAAVILSSAAGVSDPDSANFAGGRLTVTIAVNARDSDRLAVRNDGAGAGQIGIAGANVMFGGTTIGTLSGGVGSTPLVVLLNLSATVAAAQALVQAVTYQTLGEIPSMAARTITFVVRDGDGGASTDATNTVTLTPVNDAPVLSLSGTIGYTHDAAAIVLASFATVADVDSPDFSGGRLRVRIDEASASSSNRLSIGSGFTVDASSNVLLNGVIIGKRTANGFGTNELIVTFNANATKAVVQQLVRAITFKTVAGAVGQRKVVFTVSDGDGGLSAEVSKTVNVS